MKKLAKQLILMTIMVTMVLSLSCVANAKVDPADTVEGQVYYSFYSDKLVDKYPNASYAMIDLNKDGILEYILIVPSGVRQKVIIYTFQDYAVKLLKDFGPSSNFVGYKPSKAQFVISTSDGYAAGSTTVYTIKDGKLKKGTSYKATMNSAQKVSYTKNGKKISKKTYENAIVGYDAWKHPQWEIQPKG